MFRLGNRDACKVSLVVVCAAVAMLATAANAQFAGSLYVTLDANRVYKPDAVAGQVTLIPNEPGQFEIVIDWKDSYNRVVDRKVAVLTAPAETVVEFSFATDVGLTMVNSVQANGTLIGSITPVGAGSQSFDLVPDPVDAQEYHANVWGDGSTSSSNYFNSIAAANINKGHIFRTNSYYGHQHNVRPNHDFIEDKKWFEMTDTMHSPNYDAYEDALTQYVDYWLPSKRQYLVRPQSLSSAASLNLLVNTITPRLQTTAKWRPMQWNIADEYGIGRRASPFDYDLGPDCISQFITWLQGEYGTIAALNTQWGTSFTDWSDLSDPINAPRYGQEALIITQEMKDREYPLGTSTTAAKNFSPWSDFRTHMERTMVNAMQRCVDAGRAIDPTIRMGWEGGEPASPMDAYDYWQQMQVMSSFEAYDIGNSCEYATSFRDNKYGDTLLRWVTMFNTGSPTRNRYRLWYDLIHYGHRASIIWWYQDFFTDTTTYNLSSYALGLKPTYGEFQDGLAKLLAQGERDDGEIALYYSQRSNHMSWQYDSEVDGRTWVRRGGSWDSSHSALLFTQHGWQKALEDAGFKGRYVSYEQVVNGELINKGYKVLIMPRVMAMSSAEIAAVEAFADAGGVVIADGQTAVYDGRGKRRSIATGGGMMDNWFGISRATYATSERNNMSSSAWAGAPTPQTPPAGFDVVTQNLPSPFTGYAIESGTRVGDGTALALFSNIATQPVLIAKNHGAGKSVYMNLTLHRYGVGGDNYTEDRRTPSGTAAQHTRQLVTNLMALGGVTPKARVLQGYDAADTDPEVYGLEKTRFVDGDINYLACVVNSTLQFYDWSSQNVATTLFGQPGVTTANVTLALDAPAHVYDVRQKTYLGYGDRINAQQPVLEGGVFALLPYQVAGLGLDAFSLDSKQRASVTASVLARTTQLGRHVFRLEVFDNTAQAVTYLTRNVVAENGVWSGVIPFALDANIDGWTVRLTDVATGATIDQTIARQLVASDPAADTTLSKVQNNVIRLTFLAPIALPAGSALQIVPITGGADLGGSFTYQVEAGTTLNATETGQVLTNQTWYRVTPAASFDVEPFTIDLCTLIGDANADRRVMAVDLGVIWSHNGEVTDTRYDIDGNGQVMANDLGVAWARNGTTTPTKP